MKAQTLDRDQCPAQTAIPGAVGIAIMTITDAAMAARNRRNSRGCTAITSLPSLFRFGFPEYSPANLLKWHLTRIMGECLASVNGSSLSSQYR